MASRHSGQGRRPRPGIQEQKNWIPACAGMTERLVSVAMLSARAMVNSEWYKKRNL